jgi:hypothetical protein
MSLAMIEHDCRVLIAHAEQRHSPMNVWVIASNDMTRRYIDNIFAFIRKDALYCVGGRAKTYRWPTC